MNEAAPVTEAAPSNQPINLNTIRALRHMLSAVANLQSVSAVTQSEQLALAEIHMMLRANVRRLAGNGGAL